MVSICVSAATSVFFALLDRLGTRNLLYKQKSLIVPFCEPCGKSVVFDSSKLPGMAGSVVAFLTYSNLSLKEKISTLRFLVSLQLAIHPTESANRRLSVSDLLSMYGQSENSLKYFWTPLVLAAMNARVGEAPARQFIEILKRSFFSSSENSALFFPQTTLDELFAPFEAHLNTDSRVIYGTSVRNIICDDDKVAQVVLSNGDTIRCDGLIAAVPPQNLLRILPEFLQDPCFFDRARNVRPSGIISAYLWTDKPITNFDFACLPSSLPHWLFAKRGNTLQNSSYLYTTTISAAGELLRHSNEELADRIFHDLMKTFQPDEKIQLLHSKVIKETKATYIFPAENSSAQGYPLCPIDNLFVCGDWTIDSLPATMESAAESGEKAAADLFNYLSESM